MGHPGGHGARRGRRILERGRLGGPWGTGSSRGVAWAGRGAADPREGSLGRAVGHPWGSGSSRGVAWMGSKAPNPREGSSDLVSPTRPGTGSSRGVAWAGRGAADPREGSLGRAVGHPWGSGSSRGVALYCLYSLNHHQNPLANTLLGKMFTWGALDTIAPPRFFRCSQSAAPGAVPDEGETVPNSPNAASCARPNSIAASDKRVSRNSIFTPTHTLRRSIWISATKAFCYCRRPGRGGAED